MEAHTSHQAPGEVWKNNGKRNPLPPRLTARAMGGNKSPPQANEVTLIVTKVDPVVGKNRLGPRSLRQD